MISKSDSLRIETGSPLAITSMGRMMDNALVLSIILSKDPSLSVADEIRRDRSESAAMESPLDSPTSIRSS